MEFVDTTQVDHSMVALEDRAGAADFEFMFDGRVYVKPKGKTTWHLPRYVAGWLLRRDRDKVWTTDGVFAHRFGLGANDESLQQELVGELGKAVEDITPITINTEAVEGWDTTGAEREGRGTEVRRLRGPDAMAVRSAQRERLGGAAVPAFSKS